MKLSEDKIQILDRLEKNTTTIIRGEAGTGKTLIGSLGGQKLLENSEHWERVLYLTYSKLAKRQISNTIKKLKENGCLKYEYAKRMDIMNYHSFWWHLVNEYYSFLGITNPPLLYTKKELKKNASSLIDEIPYQILPDGFITKSGSLNKKKIKMLEELVSGSSALYWQFGPEHFGKRTEIFVGSHNLLEWSKSRIFKRNKEGFFSHDETVCWVYTLLSKHPNLLSLIRNKYSVFIFDEFQDTDIAQWEIVKLISPKTIIILADPAQTIHTWRGADPKRLEQLELFCEEKGIYNRIKNYTLIFTHRSNVNMSEPQNIFWKDVGKEISLHDAEQYNRLKMNAKYHCKRLYLEITKNNKKVAILCLTNKITDEITYFFRSQQNHRNGTPAMYPARCMRYGSDYSPFELARAIISELMYRVESSNGDKLEKYLANEVFDELFFQKIERCGKRSRKKDLKDRWRLAVKLKDSILVDFGDGLKKLKLFVRHFEPKIQIFCDRTILNTINRVGTSIQRMGEKKWKALSSVEKRIKIDSVVLQYEEALTRYHKDSLYIMTIHQAKGLEFDDVVIFWFSTRAWDSSEGYAWDMNSIEHKNLFHTACTRARNRVFVIRPRAFPAPWPPDLSSKKQ